MQSAKSAHVCLPLDAPEEAARTGLVDGVRAQGRSDWMAQARVRQLVSLTAGPSEVLGRRLEVEW